MADPLYPKRMLSQVREIRIADAPHDKHVSLRVGDCANMYIRCTRTDKHSCMQTYVHTRTRTRTGISRHKDMHADIH